MIIFAIIWAAGGAAILMTELISAMNHPEDEKSRWWLLEVLGVAVSWPLILVAMIFCGVYTTIKMEI